MFHLNKILFISCIILLLCFQIYPQQKVVYIGLIDGEIDLGLSPYVSRVISEAEKENADAVIFKINTFGGRVDAA
ncbi:MAG: nodulation protein NfeD, partial [Ignavibacteria bacterium]